MPGHLIGSFPTFEALEKGIEEYYCNTKYTIDIETGTIKRVSDGYVPPVKVIKKKGRYRFECDYNASTIKFNRS